MQGTPYIYQGQEIGMTNTKFSSIEDFDDVWSINRYHSMKKDGMTDEAILGWLSLTSRDNARTPMQWDATANAGFSAAKPWLKVNPNYTTINVQQQEAQPDSVLNFYRQMIRLRKAESVLVYGSYELLMEDDQQIYAYTRTLDTQKVVIICNMSDHDAMYHHEDFKLWHDHLWLNNYAVLPHSATSQLLLQPYEVRVYRVS